MDKHIKAKAVMNIICLIVSIFALYTFIFVAEISIGWRIALIATVIFWIISGISNLIEYFWKKLQIILSIQN